MKMLQLNMRQGKKEILTTEQSSSLHSEDWYQFLRTLTRILSSWLHITHISSLVFIIWGWPCQMSIYLILWSNFLLEKINDNIKLHCYFLTCKNF